MMTYPISDTSTTVPATVRLIGLGNAGVHLADRVAIAGLPGVDVVAMNTDTQSLTSSICETKTALGGKVTRGLGAGGDPDVGAEAANESLEELRAAVEGAGVVFLCTGLGGGTGSGVAPLLAEVAREAGATVFALVTSPFSFEGRRRAKQSADALSGLAPYAQVLIHFENDRMSEIAAPRSGVEETFATADSLLLACVQSLCRLLEGGGPMPVGLNDLLAALGTGASAGLFGRGEGTGDNRAHDALERALKSPLLDRGRMLDDSHAVVVQVTGPTSLTFAEVSAVMNELGRHISEEAQLFLGVSTRTGDSEPVCVTILGNCATQRLAPVVARQEKPAEPEVLPAATPVIAPEPAPVPVSRDEPGPLFPEPDPEPVEHPAVAARQTPREPKPAPKPKPAPTPAKAKQETLQFESVARGRFEKSEPTIVEGEDLDVPTFLRMRGKNS